MLLKDFTDQLPQYLRACANCGSAIGQVEHLRTNASGWLCRHCEPALQQFAYSNEVEGYPFCVRSLFMWPKSHQRFFQRIIYSLKGESNARTYEKVAMQFVSQQSLAQVKSILVPSPAANTLRPIDHAGAFSLALTDVTNFETKNILKRNYSAKQKKRNLKDRQKVSDRFSIRQGDKFTRLSPTDKIVFVDDLITTGYSALAAYEALNNPEDFEVWTLFHRPRDF